MAWAVFTSAFNFDRRPKQALAFAVKPGTHNLPRDVVDAAIAAGKARRIEAPNRQEAKILQARETPVLSTKG